MNDINVCRLRFFVAEVPEAVEAAFTELLDHAEQKCLPVSQHGGVPAKRLVSPALITDITP
jgi:hypothetical protein